MLLKDLLYELVCAVISFVYYGEGGSRLHYCRIGPLVSVKFSRSSCGTKSEGSILWESLSLPHFMATHPIIVSVWIKAIGQQTDIAIHKAILLAWQ